MLDWIVTALVLVIGVAVLVTGFIKLVLIGFMVFLALCVIVEVISAYRSASYDKSSE